MVLRVMFRVLSLFIVSSLIVVTSTHAAPLQPQLEAVYGQWRAAMVKKDYKGWQRVTAYARQMETRNTVVSQKKRFPAAIFAVPMKPPALTGLQALHVKQKGVTAVGVYYGRVDFEVGQAPEHSMLVLRFLKEGAQWKFHKLAVMGQLPGQVIGDIRAGRLGFLKEPEFQPSGRAPEIQKACPKPDHITDIHLITLGFEAEVLVNGVSTHRSHDDYGTQLVMGGLRNGKNTVQIKGKRLRRSESGQRNLKITLHAKTGNRRHPAVKVFEFKPDPNKGPFNYTGTFTVDRATLRQ